MPLALRAIAGYVTNPSTTLTTWTMATNDAATVQNFTSGRAYLINMWGQNVTAGLQQVTSPRLHDTSRGIRYSILASNSIPPWQMGQKQPLFAQDLLVPQQTGEASGVDAGCMLQWFSDLGGSDARLVMPDSVASRIEQLVTVETTHTIGSTAGDWSGSVALNSGSALLRANRDYVLLGFTTNTAVCSIGIRGPDTGQQRMAGPGTTDRNTTQSWYERLSQWTNLPCCCIINAANQGATFVDLQSTATSGTVVVQHTFGLLT